MQIVLFESSHIDEAVLRPYESIPIDAQEDKRLEDSFDSLSELCEDLLLNIDHALLL